LSEKSIKVKTLRLQNKLKENTRYLGITLMTFCQIKIIITIKIYNNK
jgi:hypothetical protein